MVSLKHILCLNFAWNFLLLHPNHSTNIWR
jgi:hypothetical protein